MSAAIAINARMQADVNAKLGQLQGFLAELKAKAHRYREIEAEHAGHSRA